MNDLNWQCPVCKGEGEVEGQIGGDGWGNKCCGVHDVMLACACCEGAKRLSDERYEAACDRYGLCRGCGEERESWDGSADGMCEPCMDDAHGDVLYHNAVDEGRA